MLLSWIALRCCSSLVNSPATHAKTARIVSVISSEYPVVDVNFANDIDEVRFEDSETISVRVGLELGSESTAESDEAFALSKEARAEGLEADWTRAEVVS